MNQSTDTEKIIGALLLGAFAGVALGILFAPDKGEKTLSKVVNGAKEMADDMRQKFNDGLSPIRQKTNGARAEDGKS